MINIVFTICIALCHICHRTKSNYRLQYIRLWLIVSEWVVGSKVWKFMVIHRFIAQRSLFCTLPIWKGVGSSRDFSPFPSCTNTSHGMLSCKTQFDVPFISCYSHSLSFLLSLSHENLLKWSENAKAARVPLEYVKNIDEEADGQTKKCSIKRMEVAMMDHSDQSQCSVLQSSFLSSLQVGVL